MSLFSAPRSSHARCRRIETLPPPVVARSGTAEVSKLTAAHSVATICGIGHTHISTPYITPAYECHHRQGHTPLRTDITDGCKADTTNGGTASSSLVSALVSPCLGGPASKRHGKPLAARIMRAGCPRSQLRYSTSRSGKMPAPQSGEPVPNRSGARLPGRRSTFQDGVGAAQQAG